jgi:transmembrane sensor
MNAPSVPADRRDVRAHEAADWFLILRENASEQDLRRWVEWCVADPENLREYERVQEAWAAIAEIEPEASRPLRDQSAVRRSRLSRLRRYGLAAAACAGVVLASWWVRNPDIFVAPPKVLSAQQTANMSATLPDGSMLMLAPRTNVELDFSGSARKLDLSSGEAYFKVHPDKHKPFVVTTDALHVTAVGTAFGIKSDTQAIAVTVEEGVVEVANGAEVWRVGAGYRIEYDTRRGVARIAAIDAARALAWRDGRLEYFQQPLAAVIADVNRYSNKRIEINDPAVAQLSFTGTIFTASIDDWLVAVTTTFPLDVVVADDRVQLRGRDSR